MPKKLQFLLYCLIPFFTLLGQENFAFGEATESRILHIAPDAPPFQKGKYQLADYLYVLVDSTDELTFLECSSAEYFDSFQPISSISLRDLSVNQQTYWLRLTLRSDLPREEIWLTNMMEAEVTAFAVSESGVISKKRSGMLIDVKDRYFNDRYGFVAALPIHLPADTSQTYYWQVKPMAVNGKTQYDLNLDLTLLSNAYLSNFLIFDGLLLALFLGFFFAVRNISFIFYLYDRQRKVVLWYSIYCLASILLGPVCFGYDLHYLVPKMAYSHYCFLQTLVLIIWVLAFILFSRSFLQTHKVIPLWDAILWILFGSGTICLLWGSLEQWSDSAFGYQIYWIGRAILVLIAVVLGAGAISSIQKGRHFVKYYLWALVILLLGIALTLLTTFQYLPAVYHVHWVIIAAWIQLRVLAYGLGLAIPEQHQQRYHAMEESERLKELNQLTTHLYTNITHEFRTPLTVMLGIADSIKGYEAERKIIRRNGKKLLRLINQLLELSKFDTGAVQTNLRQSDIVFYLNYLVESFYSMAKEKDIRLTFYSEEEEFLMDFDEVKIQHIIYNLLSNALKFTEKGGKVFLSSRKVGSAENSQLQIKCRDTGRGIPDEQLPFVFDRFYQGDGSHTREGEGTGIGLALTKEYVELLGGKISVNSRPGKGSEFTVLLPVKNNAPLVPLQTLSHEYAEATLDWEEPDEKEEIMSPFYRSDPLEKTKPILLIVEDNRDVVLYIRSIVEKDYRIETAFNGKSGLEKALKMVPDIVISDVMMPEMDGFALTDKLKNDERTSHIPIILLTAKVGQRDRISGLQAGADAYLTKPFNKEEMLLRLEKLGNLRKAMRQYYSNIDLKQSASSSNPETAFLKKAGKVVEDNLSNSDFTVVHFCREVQLSQPQLYRKLMALTGKSPTLFIRTIRLQKALELLRNSDLNIAEVAWEVGFNDPGYFSRAFQKEFGKPPSEFRK